MALNPAQPDARTKSERTRDRILRVAAQLLAVHGYSGTRMVDIAERAELRDASLYYHFDSKDELVQEVLRTGIRHTHKNVRSAIDALPRESDAVERLATAIRTHLRCLLELSDVGAAALRIMSQVPAELSAPFRRDQGAYGALWGRLLRDGVEAGVIRDDLELPQLRLFIIGALNWVIEGPPATRRPADELAEIAEAMILEGIRADR